MTPATFETLEDDCVVVALVCSATGSPIGVVGVGDVLEVAVSGVTFSLTSFTGCNTSTFSSTFGTTVDCSIFSETIGVVSFILFSTAVSLVCV